MADGIPSEWMDWAKGHEGLAAAAVIGGAFGGYYLLTHKKASAASTNAQGSQTFGTTNINGEPGVFGFVGPGVQGPGGPQGATGATGAQGPPGGTTTTPGTTAGQTYTWKPTGALATAQSPGKMVWYAAYKGTASDPNLQYINVFNRSGQLMETINEGCVNKDTPGGEMCILNGKLSTGTSAGQEEGQGGPYAGYRPGKGHLGQGGPLNVQPFGTVGSFLPSSPLNVPRTYELRAGDTAGSLGRRFYGKPELGSRFRNQVPSWQAGQTVKVW